MQAAGQRCTHASTHTRQPQDAGSRKKPSKRCSAVAGLLLAARRPSSAPASSAAARHAPAHHCAAPVSCRLRRMARMRAHCAGGAAADSSRPSAFCKSSSTSGCRRRQSCTQAGRQAGTARAKTRAVRREWALGAGAWRCCCCRSSCCDRRASAPLLPLAATALPLLLLQLLHAAAVRSSPQTLG